MSDILDALTFELQTHGVTSWRVDRLKKHPAIVFEWEGRERRFVYAGTSCSWNGPDNAATDLRKMMGVKRVVVKSDAPKRARNKTVAKKTITLETFARSNPLAALAGARDAVKDRVKQAEDAGRRAFFCGMSGRAPDDYAPHLAKAFMKGWMSGVRMGRAA